MKHARRHGQDTNHQHPERRAHALPDPTDVTTNAAIYAGHKEYINAACPRNPRCGVYVTIDYTMIILYRSSTYINYFLYRDVDRYELSRAPAGPP